MHSSFGFYTQRMDILSKSDTGHLIGALTDAIGLNEQTNTWNNSHISSRGQKLHYLKFRVCDQPLYVALRSAPNFPEVHYFEVVFLRLELNY